MTTTPPPDRVSTAAAIAVDAGDLSLGGGLLALVRPALTLLDPGGVLAILSISKSVTADLESWCRAEGHQYLGAEALGDGALIDGTSRHLVSRGRFTVHRPGIANDFRSLPTRADTSSGFAPQESVVEPGGPAYPFDLVERDRVIPPEVTELYEQAVAAQWTAADIPWSTIAPQEPAVELAIRQVMTFLAENELSALYVPSRFVARIHPAYVAVAMFLATQMQDESRHIDVFLRRARATASPPAIASATTSRSLHSLLQVEDFTESAFLLSVLGEGTFLDLLAFVERFAPDEATEELAKRARSDEARHVHFGLAHVRHALAHDDTLYARLETAVRRRAATLAGIGGVPAPVQDALTIYAAAGSDPRRVARGHDAYRELLATMHEGRIRRLRSAGFTAEQANTISDLHTPNFM
jgi:TusA-related sulfurtransferase